MKKQYFIFVLGFVLCACMNKKGLLSQENSQSKMDWEQFQNDLKFVDEINEFPLGNGVFPVSEYESSGNGNVEKKIQILDFDLIQQSVFVYQGDYNKSFFNGVKDPNQELIYFTILVKASFQDSLNQIMSSSRNHPIYLGQGIVKLKDNRSIRWVASQSDDLRHDMAIVNMKYFDLTKGRLIIVVPMEDGSLRYKQLNIKEQSLIGLDQIIQERRMMIYSEIKGLSELNM